MHVSSKRCTEPKGYANADINIAQISATAGALAGAVARFVVGPLDVIKIRFQVQLEPIAQGGPLPSKYTSLRQAVVTIVKEEGIQVSLQSTLFYFYKVLLGSESTDILLLCFLQGLWRGTIPGQLLTIPYTAVQFLTLQQCKSVAEKNGLGNLPGLSFANGAIAGAAGTAASYPFDLLRTTLAAQGEPRIYRGMNDAARAIIKKNGVLGLYRGVGVTLLEIMPYAALQFGLFEALNNFADGLRVRPAILYYSFLVSFMESAGIQVISRIEFLLFAGRESASSRNNGRAFTHADILMWPWSWYNCEIGNPSSRCG